MMKSQVYDGGGTYTWTNPDHVGCCWCNIWGATAGAYGGAVSIFTDGSTFGSGSGGSGSPETLFGGLIATPSGASVSIVVGAGGAGGQIVQNTSSPTTLTDSPAPTAGGDSSAGPWTVCGGKPVSRNFDLTDLTPGGLGAFQRIAGTDGGGPRGGDGGAAFFTSTFQGALGGRDAVRHHAGSGGGSGETSFDSPTLAGYPGGGGGGHLQGAVGGSGVISGLGAGGGGGCDIFGPGSPHASEGGDDGHHDGWNANTVGAGAGGGRESLHTGSGTGGLPLFAFYTGGNGNPGRVEIFWIAP